MNVTVHRYLSRISEATFFTAIENSACERTTLDKLESPPRCQLGCACIFDGENMFAYLLEIVKSKTQDLLWFRMVDGRWPKVLSSGGRWSPRKCVVLKSSIP